MARATNSGQPVNLNMAIQSKSGGYYIPADQLNVMVNGVMQILRNNFKSMIDDLKSGKTRTKPQNWYDKIRNFLWGYDNPNNPWYQANRIGGLGQVSPRNEVSLQEYKTFNGWIKKYNSLNITEARLVLDDMIRPHIEKIEDEIRDYIRTFVQPYYVYRPEFGPPKEEKAVTGGKGSSRGSGKKNVVSGEKEKQPEKQPEKPVVSKPKAGPGDPFDKKSSVKSTVTSEIKPQSKTPAKRTSHPKTLADKLKQDAAAKAALKAAEIEDGHSAYENYIVAITKPYFKDFDGCTLYERTLICLDKMRKIKED
jgi:hypothetical protein